MGAGEHRHGRDRVVGVERPEAVAGRGDRPPRPGDRPARGRAAGPRTAVISATGKSTPSSAPSAPQRRREARDGVDQGHVEVEADDQRGRPRRGRRDDGHATKTRHGLARRPIACHACCRSCATMVGDDVHEGSRTVVGAGLVPAPRAAARRGVRRAALAVALAGGLVAGVLTSAPLVPAAAISSAGRPALYLVTLDGPGTAGSPAALPAPVADQRLHHQQDLALAAVGAPAPVYRWTTALNGFAVRLSRAQAAALAAEDGVALGRARRGAPPRREPRARPGPDRAPAHRAAAPARSSASSTPASGPRARCSPTSRGSAARRSASAGPASAARTGRRRQLQRQAGRRALVRRRLRRRPAPQPRPRSPPATTTATAPRWPRSPPATPGSRVQVHGAAARQLRRRRPAGAGRGLQGLLDRARPRRRRLLDRRPRSPRSTRAVRDRVDVLNLSVGGPDSFDTVERALLGAAEADVVVVAAAGNDGRRAFAAHPGPWVTTVGGTTGDVPPRARVAAGRRSDRSTGAMASTRGTGPARVVLGADVAAPGASRAAARVCRPGSLDAARVAGAIVLCERGGIGRVDKSAAVARGRRGRDGAGQHRPGPVDADFHSVPDRAPRPRRGRGPASLAAPRTRGAGPRCARSGWPAPRPRLRRAGRAGGDPTAGVAQARRRRPRRRRARRGPADRAQHPLGLRLRHLRGRGAHQRRRRGAALPLRLAGRRGPLRARDDRGPRCRTPPPCQIGAGRVRRPRRASRRWPTGSTRARYRAWLETGRRADLNTPSVLLAGRRAPAPGGSSPTSAGGPVYFSSRGHRLHPPRGAGPARGDPAGARRERDVPHRRRATPAGPLDDGCVTWRGANGTRTRIPVLISR